MGYSMTPEDRQRVREALAYEARLERWAKAARPDLIFNEINSDGNDRQYREKRFECLAVSIQNASLKGVGYACVAMEAPILQLYMEMILRLHRHILPRLAEWDSNPSYLPEKLASTMPVINNWHNQFLQISKALATIRHTAGLAVEKAAEKTRSRCPKRPPVKRSRKPARSKKHVRDSSGPGDPVKRPPLDPGAQRHSISA